MRNKTFISSMVGIAAAVSVAGSANQTFAATLDFTGWTSYGASNAQGTWARFNLTATPYNLYTRSFVYDGSLTGSGFTSGDVIIAIGAGSVTGLSEAVGLGATGWKFQMGSSSNPWYAGNVATDTAGRSTFTGTPAGSFTLQSSNSGQNLSRLTVRQPDTTTLAADLSNSTFARLGDGSTQIYLNTSTLSAASVSLGLGPIPAFTPGSIINTAFYARDGSLQETLVNISVVPAPGALALLGVAGLAGARRRRA